MGSFVYFPHDLFYTSEHGLCNWMDPERLNFNKSLYPLWNIGATNLWSINGCGFSNWRPDRLLLHLLDWISQGIHTPSLEGLAILYWISIVEKKCQSQWLTIPMDFVTKSVRALTVYMYLYPYSLTLVNMNKTTNDSVIITGQVYAC